MNPALHRIKMDWVNQFFFDKIQLVIQKERLNNNISISKIRLKLDKKGRAG
jgi:hypothetical protein